MGNYVPALVSILPVVVLIVLMVKPNPWPSYRALPLTAVIMYLLKLTYFESAPNETNATVLKGILTAATPILIIWGAILLFTIMERSGCLDTVRNWLNNITPNRVAQLMIIGWAFSFMIEGASGFGTPAALAAPLLVGLGVDPLKVALLCLTMNSVPVSFGAVGTPSWFGFGPLKLADDAITQIGIKTVIMHAAAAMVIPLIALRFVVGWAEIKRNLLFIYLSILSCIVPYIVIAFWSYEFPSLCAGFIGFLVSIFIASQGWGLHKSGDEMPQGWKEGVKHTKLDLVKALFPLWGTVLVLVISRISYIGIKSFLTYEGTTEDSFIYNLGNLGVFSTSPSLVFKLQKIFNTAVGWKCQLLYIPAIVPFFLVSLLAVLICRMPAKKSWTALKDSAKMMRNPVISLASALVLVTLLMSGGEHSCAQLIGRTAADLAGNSWFYFAPYLGALGSFFSGSNTVSNLTFGGIQQSIATGLGLNQTTILALQSVGGAMGNMVCINNIVAVGSILGLLSTKGYEGKVVKKTVLPMLVYGVIALVVASFF